MRDGGVEDGGIGGTGDPSSLCKLRRTGGEVWPPVSPSCRLYEPEAVRAYAPEERSTEKR